MKSQVLIISLWGTLDGAWVSKNEGQILRRGMHHQAYNPKLHYFIGSVFIYK
jgi:hypothetical protein